ncbi:MAG TPA: DM13 domain-containing protein [Solirubrobacteraceae bacterium]|nr:DM13 domain-containing protein [Solirubrobacteraceae bacterium]
MRRLLIAAALAAGLGLALPAGDGWAARNVELLHGKVRAVGHSANGRAAVVLTGGRRVLTLRRFRIDPGPNVRVWLVPRSARGDGQIPKDYEDLGRLKGNRGDQQYRIPARVDLRRYRSVIFWCVPFTQTLARADLVRS